MFDIINIKPPSGDTRQPPDVPPPGTGNRSLSQLCQEFKLDCESIIKALVKKGMQVNSATSLKALATENELTSIELYDLIKKIAKTAAPSETGESPAEVSLPNSPEPGT